MPGLLYVIENFGYFDKPDGQDPIGKILGLAPYGVVTGTWCTLFDACLVSHCTNAKQFLNTAGYWMVPLTGMCLAFSGVTYVSTKIRKKDDKVNYVLGALASGSILHAWQRHPMISGWGTALMVFIAVMKKDQRQHNYNTKNILFPEKMPVRGYFSWRNVPYRNFNPEPWRPFDKLDYYKNFNYKLEN
ncbi:hypothetical protein TKK_0007045 [Trichogramma kaykai]|uniref:NADH dehydrogenase [ubiquinone] 1 alpha subcomplex subunit 11 n=1 Tax=Trichogramma kaykai TaxID=54128 RepID=A0ABD2X9S0_9HYME